ncbi:MAG: cytochrome b [Magnetospirillum sp. WYHS-4]
MNEPAAPARYDGMMIGLHWLIAALIVGLWILGHWMEGLPKGDYRAQVFGLHKAIGVVVLALVAARLAWRALRPVPDLPGGLGPVERLAAKAGHALLYVLMVGLPVGGIVMSQSGGRPVSVFGLVLPTLVEKNEALHKAMETMHSAFGWVLAVLFVAHVAAALRHQYRLKDGLLDRMRPLRGA